MAMVIETEVDLSKTGQFQTTVASQCGTCVMCCITTNIPELAKPSWTICTHCTGTNCSIYQMRPESCRTFECGWYRYPELIDELRPDRCGIMIEILDRTHVILAVVDPKRPDAWRVPLVTTWLRQFVDSGHPVIVTAGPGMRNYYLIRGQQDVAAVNGVIKGMTEAASQRMG